MRFSLLLDLTVAAAVTLQHDQPVKKAFGPEHRNCRAGSKTKADEAVIGGTVVNDNSKYPFLAWVGDNDGTGLGQFCAGTLIHERVVMTAAHCVYHSDSKNANMYIRFHLANFAKTHGVARNVINWKVNEKYNEMELTDDIALLLLNESATTDPDQLVYPVALSNGTYPMPHETNATIVGWGSTDEECRVYDTYLRDSHVPIGPSSGECSTPGSKALRTSDIDLNKQICAGYYVKDAMEYPGCGDSGGPLLSYDSDDEKYVQVGFVSWSYGVPYPDVFTRVSAFRDWIDTNVELLLKAGKHPAAKDKEESEASKGLRPHAFPKASTQ